MRELTIADTAIRQDAEGRYCLNDLHRASGAEAKHQPANWLRLQQTQDLAAELDREAIPQNRGIESRQGLGTFVRKELVYAYAMWISPAFHLKVIRAYDSMATGQPQALNLRDPRQLAAAALQLIEVNQELQAKVQTLQVTADAHDRLARADGSMCITDAAKALQMRPRDLFSWLQQHRWIYRRAGGAGWLGYQDRTQARLLEHKVTTVDRPDGSQKIIEQVLVTAKGLAKLSELLTPALSPPTGGPCPATIE